MTGGTEFIVAAYLLAAVILGSYSIGLVRRLRRERELQAREAGRSSVEPPPD